MRIVPLNRLCPLIPAPPTQKQSGGVVEVEDVVRSPVNQQREPGEAASGQTEGQMTLNSGWFGTRQRTLAQEFERSGVGLHSGCLTSVRVKPAEPGQGRYFVRIDRSEMAIIPAQIDRVSQTMLSTELTNGEDSVRTVEHLLAALSGLGIDNARIEIDGPEVPLLDGSARDWVAAIEQAGCVEQTVDRPIHEVTEPIWVYQGDAFVAALPSPEWRLSYGINFDVAAIGQQWYSWSPQQESFATAIAPARTFGLAEQVEQLRQRGLIKGGSLDNALVCDRDKWLNPPLRFSNEPVRHKLLDLIGDLSLLGYFPRAHVMAYKASHQLHTQLAQHLMQLFCHR